MAVLALVPTSAQVKSWSGAGCKNLAPFLFAATLLAANRIVVGAAPGLVSSREPFLFVDTFPAE